MTKIMKRITEEQRRQGKSIKEERKMESERECV